MPVIKARCMRSAHYRCRSVSLTRCRHCCNINANMSIMSASRDIPPPPPPLLLLVGLTVTEAEAVPVVPSVPMQLIENEVVTVRAPDARLPEVAGTVPVQTVDVGLAEAMQLLVSTELQVSVTLLPLVMLLADAVNVTVGAGGVGAT